MLDGRRVPKAGTERDIPADLVLLALGFTGPESDTIEAQLNLPFDERGNISRDEDYATSESGEITSGRANRAWALEGTSSIAWTSGQTTGPPAE